MIEVYRFTAMTTPCELRFYNASKIVSDACASSILKEVKRLELKYNYFDSHSYLHKLNSRQTCTLDNESKMLLQKAKAYYNATNAIFDISIATIKDSYNVAKLSALNRELNKLREYVGCEHFQIKRNKLSFTNPFTKIDLGGMVKEYAVDRAVSITKKHKINAALINFGGDIYALGTKPNGEAFKIGIKNPKKPQEELFSLPLSNMALTTSAHYERSKTIEKQNFSHIISANDHSNSLLSATVIAPTTLESGIYSTALMLNQELQTKHAKYLVTQDLSILS